MDQTRLQDLLRRYLDETITGAELTELQELIAESGDPGPLEPVLRRLLSDPAYAIGEDTAIRDAVFTDIMKQTGGAEDRETLQPVRRMPVRKWGWWAAAVLLVAAGAYWYAGRPVRQRPMAASEKKADFDRPPGTNGAILTLSNGTQIALDSAADGTLGNEGRVALQKQGGMLRYDDQEKGLQSQNENTVATPKGRQFQLVLSDGTRVWLNAGSSIRFPAAFTGKERDVAVTGEVYFEVAKNPARPFVVQTKQSKVMVLGTHFNVMAYDDEHSISTTLAEGSVKIISGGKQLLLRPGEQGEVNRATGGLSAHRADVDQVLAWTTGRLALGNADFAMFMRQLSRWYDLDVVFEGKVPDVPVGGYINRDVPLSVILQFLKQNGVRYRAEGKRLVIL